MNRKLARFVFLAVICSIMFSTSTVMVTWLKDSFTPFGQLTIRALIALVGALGVMFVDERGKNNKFDFRDLNKYNKKLAVPVFLFRAAFNFCFIMAVSAANATIALMVLLFVKMLTNVVIDSLTERQIPGVGNIIAYLLVLAGIITYGWGEKDLFGAVLVWAAASGVLEAVRLEFIGQLKISDSDRPKFAVVEFLGMLLVVGGFLLFSNTGFLLPGVSAITTVSYYGMLFAVLAVAINAIDYQLSNSNELPKGAYSAILATEVGFAGVLNFVFLGSPFETQQIVGVAISALAIIMIGVSSAKRDAARKKEKEEQLRKEILLEG